MYLVHWINIQYIICDYKEVDELKKIHFKSITNVYHLRLLWHQKHREVFLLVLSVLPIRALALCCNAKFNSESGAEAKDWKAGKPVRVVRKYGKSKYAPVDGYRYDGIYKVVKYYPETGKSGFKVWKYSLRRDDPSPAPWTKDAPVFDVIVSINSYTFKYPKINQNSSLVPCWLFWNGRSKEKEESITRTE